MRIVEKKNLKRFLFFSSNTDIFINICTCKLRPFYRKRVMFVQRYENFYYIIGKDGFICMVGRFRPLCYNAVMYKKIFKKS